MKARSRTSHSLVGALLAALACLAVMATGSALAAGSTARSARTVSINDSAHLHRTSSHGFNLYESGNASGSLGGSVTLHLDVVSTNRVTAQLTVRTRSGSINASASGSYRNNGSTASFSGSLSVTSGSGSYSHAHGSGLSFSGTIQRSDDAVTVRVSGHFSA